MSTREYKRIIVLLLLLSTGLPVFAFGQAITVETNQELYRRGDKVTVTGQGPPESEVTISVSTIGMVIMELYVFSDESGEFESMFKLQPNAVPGIYRVTATIGLDSAEIEFQDLILFLYLKVLMELIVLMFSLYQKRMKMQSEMVIILYLFTELILRQIKKF